MTRSILCLMATVACFGLWAQDAGSLEPTTSESAEAFPWTGTVTAETLNVRANPALRYERVAQLHLDDVVLVVQRRQEWLGILPPPQTEVWISAKNLAEGRVKGGNAPLYAGPGIYFSTMGVVREGQPVHVIRVKNGMWSLIEPPETCVVWVHGDYVEAVAPPVPEPEPDPEPEPEPDPEPVAETIPDRHVEPQPPPAEDASMTAVGIPESVAAVGYIVPLGSEDGPWTYALAHKVEETYYPYVYLDKSYPNLADWVWRRVLIHGTRQWLQGWPRPQLKIDAIETVNQ